MRSTLTFVAAWRSRTTWRLRLELFAPPESLAPGVNASMHSLSTDIEWSLPQHKAKPVLCLTLDRVDSKFLR